MAGLGSETDADEGAVKVSRKALRRGLVRILIGISSRMCENVRRWLIRLR